MTVPISAESNPLRVPSDRRLNRIAGPSALAWLDLHVQTLAPLGLVVGRATVPSVRGLARAAAAAVAGTAVWALLSLAGVGAPLLAFNLTALGFLAWSGARDRLEPR